MRKWLAANWFKAGLLFLLWMFVVFYAYRGNDSRYYYHRYKYTNCDTVFDKRTGKIYYYHGATETRPREAARVDLVHGTRGVYPLR